MQFNTHMLKPLIKRKFPQLSDVQIRQKRRFKPSGVTITIQTMSHTYVDPTEIKAFVENDAIARGVHHPIADVTCLRKGEVGYWRKSLADEIEQCHYRWRKGWLVGERELLRIRELERKAELYDWSQREGA